ncbi:GTA head formation protein, RCAP_rcc01685 family [Rhodovulum adriaticum]|uniref:Gene transfer agent protein n=1 Tax=Rhodovulum adriaticum TaxID=35804 RepID=A0A4R2NV72_RHOAD|nr:hypothetical protein [Rhodovulum adriaticum]MBK1636164.1 hypothetical protein [Rhodovulum adriaticum]TCP25481.1 hypothetical protein EV656_103233 [Rhodovulum adriaticum]
MSAAAERTGSRFLYAPFEVARERIDANERVMEARWAALEYRLARIEASLERLEKRMWLTVYGVVAVILAEGAASVLALTP